MVSNSRCFVRPGSHLIAETSAFIAELFPAFSA
jgi:hypothetical protein